MKKGGPLPGRLQVILFSPLASYQLNLKRTWIWRGSMFCVETVDGKIEPKLALFGVGVDIVAAEIVVVEQVERLETELERIRSLILVVFSSDASNCIAWCRRIWPERNGV